MIVCIFIAVVWVGIMMVVVANQLDLIIVKLREMSMINVRRTDH